MVFNRKIFDSNRQIRKLISSRSDNIKKAVEIEI